MENGHRTQQGKRKIYVVYIYKRMVAKRGKYFKTSENKEMEVGDKG